jgi:hypothetical protein
MRIKCEKPRENIDVISAKRFARKAIEPPNTPSTPNGIAAIIVQWKSATPLVPPANPKASSSLSKIKKTKTSLVEWKSTIRHSKLESIWLNQMLKVGTQIPPTHILHGENIGETIIRKQISLL